MKNLGSEYHQSFDWGLKRLLSQLKINITSPIFDTDATEIQSRSHNKAHVLHTGNQLIVAAVRGDQ
jgi:hypothetical protein